MITRRSFFQFAGLAVAAGTAGLAATLAPTEAKAERERVRDHRTCRPVPGSNLVICRKPKP